MNALLTFRYDTFMDVRIKSFIVDLTLVTLKIIFSDTLRCTKNEFSTKI